MGTVGPAALCLARRVRPGFPRGLRRAVPKASSGPPRATADTGLRWVSLPWLGVRSVSAYKATDSRFPSAPRRPWGRRLPSDPFAPAVSSGAAWPASRGTGTTWPLVRQEPRPSPPQAWPQKSECAETTLWLTFQGCSPSAFGDFRKPLLTCNHPDVSTLVTRNREHGCCHK